MLNSISESERLKQLEAKLKRLEDKINLVVGSIGDDASDYTDSSLVLGDDSDDFDIDAYIDVYDLAKLCKVSPRTVYNWIYQGKIPYNKINGRVLFSKERVRSFISNREYKKGK